MKDVTQKIQELIDKRPRKVNLTPFDGKGVTSLNLPPNEKNIRFYATRPITLYMLPLMHPTLEGISKSVGLFNLRQTTQDFIHSIEIDRNITVDGSYTLEDSVALTQREAPRSGLHRNGFMHALEDGGMGIGRFECHANWQNMARSAVQLRRAGIAHISGDFVSIGMHCLGVVANEAELPMTIRFFDSLIHHTNSAFDFTAPATLKDWIPAAPHVAEVNNVTAINVTGRTKCHASCWELDFRRFTSVQEDYPNRNIYAGFTAAAAARKLRLRDCRFDGFIRGGFEVRQKTPTIIENLTVKNSLHGYITNGDMIVNGFTDLDTNVNRATQQGRRLLEEGEVHETVRQHMAMIEDYNEDHELELTIPTYFDWENYL